MDINVEIWELNLGNSIHIFKLIEAYKHTHTPQTLKHI